MKKVLSLVLGPVSGSLMYYLFPFKENNFDFSILKKPWVLAYFIWSIAVFCVSLWNPLNALFLTATGSMALFILFLVFRKKDLTILWGYTAYQPVRNIGSILRKKISRGVGWSTLYILCTVVFVSIIYLYKQYMGIEVLGYRPGENPFEFNPRNIAIYIVFAFLQELCFRRVLVYLMGGTALCAILSSLCFGVFHYWYGPVFVLWASVFGYFHWVLYMQTNKSLGWAGFKHAVQGLLLFYVDFI
jgi:hypothetical protein